MLRGSQNRLEDALNSLRVSTTMAKTKKEEVKEPTHIKISNGINSHTCESVDEAYRLGYHYARELGAEIDIYFDNVKVDVIPIQRKPWT